MTKNNSFNQLKNKNELHYQSELYKQNLYKIFRFIL